MKRGVRWRKLRLEVLDRDRWRCQACKKAGILEVDHIVPVQDGGAAYDPGNLQVLCRGCHIDKHRRVDPIRDTWAAAIAELID